MSNYHAYSSDEKLVADAVVVVTGNEDPIDVQVSDRLTIEGPQERLTDALVLNRDDDSMLIAIAEGPTVALRITGAAQSRRRAQSGGFPQQCWVVV